MTNMHIGTDIVKISRIERLIQDKIPSKIYTVRESEYINSKKDKAQTASGIYAAKEAVLKCLGTGMVFPLTDVEICHEKSGMPCVELCGKALSFARDTGLENMQISISHDGEYAIATAVADTDKKRYFYKKVLNKFSDTRENIITPEYASGILPKREKNTHKGSYGKLFVLAGSTGLTGAAVMCCTSALKSGAGLITLGCAKELNSIFETSLTEVMTKPLDSKDGVITTKDTDKILNLIQNSDVCLLGPGLGRGKDINQITKDIIKTSQIPLVLDADAIFAISENPSILGDAKCPVILTPHIGEFSNLTGLKKDEILSCPEKYGCEFSKKYGVTLVLKSHETIVCTKDGEFFRNILGNPGMATGGTGDVLAGCVASFLAQGISPEDSAKVGVYLHSLAADMAAMEKGEYSLTPSDIIEYLPYSIKYTTK